MGMEVGKSDGFEVAPAPLEGKPEQNGKGDRVSIKFGSHDETNKGDEIIGGGSVFSSDPPKDAAEEWPVAKRIHTFYFVRNRPYEDPKIKVKLEQADKELQKLNRARAGIVDELKSKRAARSELFDQLEPLKNERKGFNTIFDEKRKEMEPLQQALGKLRSNDGGGGRGGVGLCSSEQELNDMIYGLQYRIQHESISLNEEKQILKEMKQLEGTREKVIANAAVRAKIKESLGQKDDIQDQVKSMGADLDGVKKERQAISAKINQLSEKVRAIKEEIQTLENDLKLATEKRDNAFSNIQHLRKLRDETNASFYQSRTVLNKARELAAQKNIKDLEALSHAEVDKFMSLWCSKKNFRDDYEKRILASLDARQLSRDGRIRNPEEKPLVTPEAPPSNETASVPEVAPKAKAKQAKDEDAGSAQKTQNAAGDKAKGTGKAKEAKTNTDDGDGDGDGEEVYGLGKSKKEEEVVVDAATLKETKRQEEAEKAKQAKERKKKLAEKAATKAAIRAQREAEKKEKEREKRAKKKAGVGVGVSAEAEAEEVGEGSEHGGKSEEEAPVEEERKPEKEKGTRSRAVRRPRGPETLPRAILKRKKPTNYWVYAVPAALAVLILLVLGYFYAL